ncbi:hypothetical protein [Pleurocapsa sp. PCC 7319]|uniref:hypothetical protein n=1 Tax=Pleurocapsa sp. PCC 7319 TaxID=118161 RepID=UPI0003678B3F|nr:hypothetical protein [Pleurocapsa sp. PCC 7319]
MSRLKLFLFLLIIALLGIIFFQNREPIVLKLLCPNDAQSCLYKTPQLPLAIWISLSILAGIITSLFWQALSSYSYSSSGTQKYNRENSEPSRRNSIDFENGGDSSSFAPTNIQDSAADEQIYDSTSYEVPQEPENVERSGSNYSYKYRTASERPQDKRKAETEKTSIESELNLDNQERDDEDWI